MKDQIPKKLWLIVLAGFLLRLALVWTPPALNSDELIKVYDGACVWSTGMDHHGQRWPLFFKQSGEYSPPLYIYLSGLVAWLGGITPLTVRLLSVFLGTACILLAFGLGRAMRGRQLGEWMALLVAFSPWNLHYSRIGWEVILAVTLQLGALVYFFR
ncbi:MAG: hypothetical protein RBU29_03280, partial [bacterium]|nr:hypothetical protein [bacterium]